jgi:predicted AAA+ superfamily ATPase
VIPEYTNELILAFLEADIPLEKLNRPRLKNFFKTINFPLPSVTSSRRIVSQLAKNHVENLKTYFVDKKIFIIADDSDIKTKKYFKILAGCIEEPQKIYSIDCVEL